MKSIKSKRAFATYSSYRSHEEFNQFLELLKEQITIIPKKEISPFLDKAKKISPDPKDTVYLALAFALKSNIWSNDKSLKQNQDRITFLGSQKRKV